MPRKRQIKAKEVVHDVRNGMSGSQLMAKYGLTRQGLQEIAQRLVDNGLLRPSELPSWAPISGSRYDEVELIRTRRFPRYGLATVDLFVWDAENPSVRGRVIDISEEGIAVQGIEAQVEETKNFLMIGHQKYLAAPISFDAECRWVYWDQASGMCTSGYEIVMIAEDDVERLRSVIDLVKIETVHT
ncbi:MAG: PilZ domain-containing protein [Desulfomonile tiedjei]|nr:PilZ domain-containing protein [Desulfomonile tiedjei]